MSSKKTGSLPPNYNPHPTIPQRLLEATMPQKLKTSNLVVQSYQAGGQRKWLILLGWNLSMLFGVMMVIIMTLAMIYKSNLIMPGVQALGIDLGTKSTNQAALALQQYWQQQTVTLHSKENTATVHPQMLGISLDAPTMVQQAHQHGRSLESLQEIYNHEGHINIFPIWLVDTNAAHTNLQGLAQQFYIAPVNAKVQIVNAQAKSTPPLSGKALDVAATVDWLIQHTNHVALGGELEVAMVPVMPDIVDVSPIVQDLNTRLANSISIYIYDPVRDERITWTITPAEWADWVTVGVSNNDPSLLQWTLDTQKIESFVLSKSSELGADRYLELENVINALQNAITTQSWATKFRLYHHPRQHTVQTGETLASIGYNYGIPYPWIQQANPGISDSLYIGQALTIPSPDVLIPLPVVENKRITISLSQQKMWAYQDGVFQWEWVVSTGIESSPTAPGVFQIQTHQVNAYASNWDLWMPHFIGIYRPVPTSDFMNGFHGFPTRNGANLLWTNNLGHPVTYGCILVSSQNAVSLFDWAEKGVIVEVIP